MENLKIRVNGEVENKEAQGIFKILGGSWSEHVNADHYDKEFLYLTNGVIEYDDLLYEFLAVDECKEITLPELRDMVVLKRNNKNDRTHRCENGCDWYIGADEYIWEIGNDIVSPKWAKVGSHEFKLKPIGEKEMKEYLIKSGDGKYLLTHHDSIGAIEIPEGADIYMGLTGKINGFYKDNFKQTYLDDDGWVDTTAKNSYDWLRNTILWQRNQEQKQAEFLVKTDSGYVLQVLDENSGGEDVVRIPEGATAYVNVFEFGQWEASFYDFGKKQPLVFCDNEWTDFNRSYPTLQSLIDDGDIILWQRHTHPEELPFIDDEPLLQTEIESELDQVENLRELLTHYTPPLNDQYAEIEKVRQSAWQKQEGGSHYKGLKIQPMQYALENKLDYAQANVVKYVTRHADKNGKEDLLKAIHNIELMIEFYYGEPK